MFHRTIADEPRPIHAHTKIRRFSACASTNCRCIVRIVVCADGAESTDASNDSTGISESVLCVVRAAAAQGAHTVHEAGIIAPRIAGRKDARRTVVWIDNTELIARGLLHCIGKQDRHGTRADGLAYLVEWDVGPAMGVLRQQHARGVARRPV